MDGQSGSEAQAAPRRRRNDQRRTEKVCQIEAGRHIIIDVSLEQSNREDLEERTERAGQTGEHAESEALKASLAKWVDLGLFLFLGRFPAQPCCAVDYAVEHCDREVNLADTLNV